MWGFGRFAWRGAVELSAVIGTWEILVPTVWCVHDQHDSHDCPFQHRAFVGHARHMP